MYVLYMYRRKENKIKDNKISNKNYNFSN